MMEILEDQSQLRSPLGYLVAAAAGAAMATAALVIGAWVAAEKAWRSAQG